MAVFLNSGPVTDSLWGAFDGANRLKNAPLDTRIPVEWTDYNSSQAYYEILKEDSVKLLSTSTSWIGRYQGNTTGNARYYVSFDYRSDSSNSGFVIDNDGMMNNSYNTSFTAQTYWQTWSKYVDHTDGSGAIYHYLRRTSGGNIFIKNFRFWKSSSSPTLVEQANTGQTISTSSNWDGEGGGNWDLESSTPTYLDFGSDITVKSSGGWTVETWFKKESGGGSYDNVYSPHNFIGSESITHNSWYWSVLNNKLALWNRSPGTWRYGSTTISNGVWYQAVITCDTSGQYQFYLNGVAEGGDHTTYSWNNSYSGLIIRYFGRGNSSNTRRFDGKHALVRVYTKELSANEVKQNFAATRGRFGI